MKRRGVLKFLLSVAGASVPIGTAIAIEKKNAQDYTTYFPNIDDVVKFKGYVDPIDFGATNLNAGTENIDSTEAFQRAIDYAEKNNIGEVKFSGKYLITKPFHSVELPGDDGSLSPELIKRGENNLNAENKNIIKACLKISSDIRFSGINKEFDMLIGDWDIEKSPVDLTQKIGLILINTTSRNTIRYDLNEFTMCNYMIARGVFSISENSYESLKFINCGISGVKLGIERCSEGEMIYSGCLSGDVIGGWWTHRNATSQDPSYLPPYPANDVNIVGWIDFSYTQEIQYAQRKGKFDERNQSIDTFFNDYFFKEKNSDRTSMGGRLSNIDAPEPAVMPIYDGISGRARTYFSRYGRAISCVAINRLKTLGCHKTPILISSPKQINCYINDAYVERSGLIDNSTAKKNSNLLSLKNENTNDKFYSVSQGMDVKQAILSTGNQSSDTNNKSSATLNKKLSIENLNLGDDSNQEYFEVTEFDGKSVNKKYKMDSNYFHTMPLIFEGSDKPFFIKKGVFTPKLNFDYSKAEGVYLLTGNIIIIEIELKNIVIASTNFGMIISELPYEPDDKCMFSINNIFIENLKKDIHLSARMKSSSIEITKDSAGSKIEPADFDRSTANLTAVFSYLYK